MTQTATVAAPLQNAIAAVFNLDDPVERFFVDILQRFHEDRLYRAHGLRRTTNAQGHRIIVELARFCGHGPGWEVIYWNPDDRSVRFQPCQGKQEAVAAYNMEPLSSLAKLRGVCIPKPT
jgi:hypothetical protein